MNKNIDFWIVDTCVYKEENEIYNVKHEQNRLMDKLITSHIKHWKQYNTLDQDKSKYIIYKKTECGHQFNMVEKKG